MSYFNYFELINYRIYQIPNFGTKIPTCMISSYGRVKGYAIISDTRNRSVQISRFTAPRTYNQQVRININSVIPVVCSVRRASVTSRANVTNRYRHAYPLSKSMKGRGSLETSPSSSSRVNA